MLHDRHPFMATRSNVTTSSEYPSTYKVFISHAEEDTDEIAIPLKRRLDEQGVTAFVNGMEVPNRRNTTTDMDLAMLNAEVAVIVLSPEFIANKQTIKELFFFINRQEVARRRKGYAVVILPVFYRLTKEDVLKEPVFTRLCADGASLYEKTSFLKRMDNKEPEADTTKIKNALKTLHGIAGVENDFNATTGDSGSLERRLLLDVVGYEVCQICQPANLTQSNVEDKSSQHSHPQIVQNSVLECELPTAGRDGNESCIKHRILTLDERHQIDGILFRKPSVNGP